jgi:hypothetical protein
MAAYGFSEDSAKRIARVVKAVEGDTTTPTRIGPMLGGSTMSVVKVTELGSPFYTGQRVDYHASDNTMNDINEVKIRELNGSSLAVGINYIGTFSGYTTEGEPVFIVNNNGGIVSNVQCVGSVLRVTYSGAGGV